MTSYRGRVVALLVEAARLDREPVRVLRLIRFYRRRERARVAPRRYS